MFALFEQFTWWLWGLPLLVTIIVTGIFLTVRSGFFQFRHFGYIVKNMFNKTSRDGDGKEGNIGLVSFSTIHLFFLFYLVFIFLVFLSFFFKLHW